MMVEPQIKDFIVFENSKNIVNLERIIKTNNTQHTKPLIASHNHSPTTPNNRFTLYLKNILNWSWKEN